MCLRLHSWITLALAAVAVCPAPTLAQWKQPVHTWDAPADQRFEPDRFVSPDLVFPPERSDGTLGAVVGGVLGTAAGVAVYIPLVLGTRCSSLAEAMCYFPFPVALGSTLGTAVGATAGGDRPAWRRTAVGSVLGTGISVIVFFAAKPTGGRFQMFLLTVPPLGGALWGNRTGQHP